MMSTKKLVGLIVCMFAVLIISNAVLGQAVLGDDNRSGGTNVSKPIPGKIIISILQGPNEPDYFAMSNDRKVTTKFDKSALSQLESYGIRVARKAFHRGSNATYELTFDAAGREDEIVSYLRSLPYVRYAQRDYTVEFLAEPNDLFYQSDASAPLEHWVADTMNVLYGNSAIGRRCDTLFTCCPTNEMLHFAYSFRDSLHLPDNWYLQHVQANKAWDIEKGSPDVKILIMCTEIVFA